MSKKVGYEKLQIDSADVQGQSGIDLRSNEIDRSRLIWKVTAIIAILISGVFAVMLLINTAFNPSSNDHAGNNLGFSLSNIAFGSCSSYDLRDMNIWKLAIVPTSPQAWIWTGDFVYLDDNEVNCYVHEDSEVWQQSCNCTADWQMRPPYTCHAGDDEYAYRRWMQALSDEQYLDFLEFMCPNSFEQGIFPPYGTDPTVCTRPIMGIYDDHDFGGNNAYRREPHKYLFKTMFLDAIGEPPNSIRRNMNRGAWTMYKINEHREGQSVDVFLLDERYERDAIPCDTRRDFCELVVFPDTTGKYRSEKVWCKDFLAGGAVDGTGSCCSKDETIFFGWCLEENNRNHPYYRDACDVTYEEFGMKSLVLTADGDLAPPSGTEPVDVYRDSPFCEVLGKAQRRWLRSALKASTAVVKVIVSGSVLFSNPQPKYCGFYVNETTGETVDVTCRCSGDDMDCYSVAQRELMHMLSDVSGCPVVLVGDYHFSDIKALSNSADTLYAGSGRYQYDAAAHRQTLYQVMASGMSDSTAKNYSCEDYRLDPMKLRTHPECDFARGPNFGRLLFENGKHQEIDTADNRDSIQYVKLQILSGREAKRVLLEHVIDVATCSN